MTADTKVTEAGSDYRKVNPLGYVPALVLDDDTLLTEGAAIVQYVAEWPCEIVTVVSVGRSPDTADLTPRPADIMSDIWPQMTLTFHLGCACQVRLIGDE